MFHNNPECRPLYQTRMISQRLVWQKIGNFGKNIEAKLTSKAEQIFWCITIKTPKILLLFSRNKKLRFRQHLYDLPRPSTCRAWKSRNITLSSFSFFEPLFSSSTGFCSASAENIKKLRHKRSRLLPFPFCTK